MPKVLFCLTVLIKHTLGSFISKMTVNEYKKHQHGTAV